MAIADAGQKIRPRRREYLFMLMPFTVCTACQARQLIVRLAIAASAIVGGPCQAQCDFGFEQHPGGPLNATPRDLLSLDDGPGKHAHLYVGGDFSFAGKVVVNHIARWDGSEWTALDGGVDGPVDSLEALNGRFGDGALLVAAGRFSVAGSHGTIVNHIAAWNGAEWSALGSGLDGPDATVHDMIVFDDSGGDGPMLFVAGQFKTAGGVAVSNIAHWDGKNWSDVGGGLMGGVLGEGDATVEALEVFDDGSGAGPMLYAAGHFETAGGVAINKIARWDGTQWTDVGGGITTGPHIVDLMVFDDGAGGGPALYAAGHFNVIGGVAARGLARWNGATWSPIGSIETHAFLHGMSLAAFNDGTGLGLYVSGYQIVGACISRWNGRDWAGLASSVNYEPPRMLACGSGMDSTLVMTGSSELIQWRRGVAAGLSIASMSPSRTVFEHQTTYLGARPGTGGAVTAQWRFNGVPMTNQLHWYGVRTQYLELWNVQPEQAGVYDVVFTNACEEIVTPPIVLTVTCFGDVAPPWVGNLAIDVDDLLLVILNWGCAGCPGDVTGDGIINNHDLLHLLPNWGPCPWA